MNNINNISEYQKIIFANGIDESTVDYTGGIETLSKNYPFVVFLTTNSSSKLSSINGPVSNIWFDGTRLTRFIGIDDQNNTLNINDHVLKIKFDYNNGLLGIYDDNTLGSIEIIKVTYTHVDGSEREYPSIYSPYTVMAKDNKFNVLFKYVIDESTASENTHIRNVSKELSYDTDKITKYSSLNVEMAGDSNLIGHHQFTYKILEPLLNNNTGNGITFTSKYSSNVLCGGNFMLYLNPLSYIISFEKKNSNDRPLIYNGSSISLEKNSTYIVNLNFDPSNINSSYKHKLFVNISKEDDANNSYITLRNYSNLEIQNGTTSFELEVGELPANTTLEAFFNIEIKYLIGEVEGTYNYLTKYINILLAGEKTNKYFYFGYENPANNPLLLQDYSDILTEDNIGEVILWESNDYDNVRISETDECYFYCAIPKEYVNKGIKPRWNAWYHESLNHCDNQNNSLTCLEWFLIDNNKKLNGIDFVIYRKIKPGKFYGCIK